MKLIVEQNRSVYAFSTFFYTKLATGGYDGVSHWMKEIDLFCKELLLIPIHLGTHWCLATIDFKLQQFGFYDSMKGTNSTCLHQLKDYIERKACSCDKDGIYCFSKWPHVFHSDLPQQYNTSDCGVFLCMYARCLSERSLFSFSQADV